MKISPTAVSCCLAIMAVYAMPAFSAELEGGKKLRGLSSNGNGNGNGNGISFGTGVTLCNAMNKLVNILFVFID